MKKLLMFALGLVSLIALAQESAQASSERLITIEYSGGSRTAPDLRYGPYVYSHPDPEGIVGTVSNLNIYGSQAELKAPEGVLIAEAEGQREASFAGGVRVNRGRLNANGDILSYSESTGFGVLAGNEGVHIIVEPSRAESDPAEIQADSATFDVDNDVSVSRGKVLLVNGSQSAEADEVTFEEGRDLAKMVKENGQVTARRQNDDGTELIITADILRVLTDQNKLLAMGNVTLIDGAIRSTGDRVFFDDKLSRAEILGNPAISVDEENGVELQGPRLEQRTDIDVVQVLDDTAESLWNEEDFILNSEKE
ncbi:MAG: LptA/OstA family protein [Deinococcales bacterium]